MDLDLKTHNLEHIKDVNGWRCKLGLRNVPCTYHFFFWSFSSKTMFKCLNCELLFPTKDILHAHRVQMHKVKEYICQFKISTKKCTFRTFSKSPYSTQLHTLHSKEQFSKTVEKGTSNPQELKKSIPSALNCIHVRKSVIFTQSFCFQYKNLCIWAMQIVGEAFSVRSQNASAHTSETSWQVAIWMRGLWLVHW